MAGRGCGGAMGGGGLEIPAVYEEDDTPRRFRDLMAPKPTRPAASPLVGAPREDGPWTVRPGETFRDFNARIRAAGLSTPPGVPETFRGVHPVGKRPAEGTATDPHGETAKRPTPAKPAPKFLPAAAAAVEPESDRKRKRKEALKQKKAKRARADESDYDEYEIKGLRDVVKAPPKLVAPKATLKSASQKVMGQKRMPSLLPLIKKSVPSKGKGNGSAATAAGEARTRTHAKRPEGGLTLQKKKKMTAPSIKNRKKQD